MADEPGSGGGGSETVIGGATKVGVGAVAAMAGTPVVLALLIVNGLFLGGGIYILGEVSESTRERNKAQNELIVQLVRDCRPSHARWEDPGGVTPRAEPIGVGGGSKRPQE